MMSRHEADMEAERGQIVPPRNRTKELFNAYERIAELEAELEQTSNWLEIHENGEAKEMTRVAELEGLLRKAEPYLDEHCDEGPSGMGYKSPELSQLVANIQATLGLL
jgi:hypothetical protein